MGGNPCLKKYFNFRLPAPLFQYLSLFLDSCRFCTFSINIIRNGRRFFVALTLPRLCSRNRLLIFLQNPTYVLLSFLLCKIYTENIISIFTTTLELILSEIPDKNQCPPPKGWRARKPDGSRAKNGGVSGEEIFCPLAEEKMMAKNFIKNRPYPKIPLHSQLYNRYYY